jgi:hypothetical protein
MKLNDLIFITIPQLALNQTLFKKVNSDINFKRAFDHKKYYENN